MTQGARILIADDEPNIVTALEFLLQREGYDVQVARNGEEALRSVDAGRPDLILLDVMMPVVSGYDVCRRVRARPDCQGVKIVMLTARGGAGEAQKGLDVGADLYVVKPFSTRDLVEKIRALLAPA